MYLEFGINIVQSGEAARCSADVGNEFQTRSSDIAIFNHIFLCYTVR